MIINDDNLFVIRQKCLDPLVYLALYVIVMEQETMDTLWKALENSMTGMSVCLPMAMLAAISSINSSKIVSPDWPFLC